jgi:hypothetical protein
LAESSSQLLSANLQFFYFMVKSGRQNTRLFSAAFRQAAVFLFYGQVWTSKHAVVFYPFAVTRKSEVFSTL